MAFSPKTYKTIWGQFAARCAICREPLIHVNDADRTSLIGEVAHIVGDTESAARGKSLMPFEERTEPSNLMLLCRPHHKIVDDDEVLYTVERLQSIKGEFLKWVESNLANALPWKTDFSQLLYINVPRLCEVAELQGYSVDLSNYKEGHTLHSLGWELNHVMSAFRVVLSNLSLAAIPIERLEFAHEGYIGSIVSFERLRFRTKNIPMNLSRSERRVPIFSGDLSKDPHIYSKRSTWTLILNIDTTWITTSTAFVLFRPSGGQSTFSGLARITNVDYETKRMFGTPWVIALPRSPLDGMFDGSDKIRAAGEDVSPYSSNLDDLVDLEKSKQRKLFFHPPPEACDLCSRRMDDQKYMIDGQVSGSSYWACMCSRCFSRRGTEIGWGTGQLYLRQPDGWLEVAGFSPDDDDDDAN